MEKKISARFWVYHNGSFVKLSIAPGKCLSHGNYERHEEGWSSYGQQWENDGEAVTWGEYSDGVDCDGRLSQSSTYMCALGDLKARPAKTSPAHGYAPGLGAHRQTGAQYERLGYESRRTDTRWTFEEDNPLFAPVTMAFTKPGIVRLITTPPRPSWIEEDSYQRDYTAESMGY